MADDKTWRSYRANDPYRDAGDQARANGPASDPLAELARLIGQGDPFAELGRDQARSAHQPGGRAPAAPAAEDWRYNPPPQQLYRGDGARVVPRDSYPSNQDYAAEAAPETDPYRDPRGYEPSQQQTHDFVPPGYAPPGYAPQGYASQDYASQAYASQAYAPQEQPGRDYARQDHDSPTDYHGADYGLPPAGSPRGEAAATRFPELAELDALYTGEHRSASVPPHERAMPRAVSQVSASMDDEDYQDDAPLSPEDDESYDDAPRGRSHSGLVTALALIGCAVLGTAGAYAYRSYSSPAGSAGAPPIITADKSTPTKIVPAAADPQSNKSIQDRVATAGGEQLVSKQEEPVAVRELGTPANPRTVLPSPFAPPQTAPAAGGNLSEPKSVRTVPIRPDGTDMSGRPVGSLPMTTQSTTTRAAPPQPTPPAPRASAAPQTRSAAPISLEPNEPAPAPPAPRTRTAAVPPPADAPEPSAAGGFLVQLASQKSEGDAQAAFKSLQGKFPNELGGRPPVIRRVDLGSKGVFYRAMVGPFPSQREASQFCEKYKAAGGQCLLPMN